MDDTSLAPAFPAYTDADWRQLVDKVLKGGDFAKKLVAQTYEGIAIQPLYPKAEGDTARAVRAGDGPWTTIQRVDHPAPGDANRYALADLEGGASGLALILAGAPAAHGGGVRIETLADLTATLDGVMLDLVHLRVETAPFMGRHVAALLAALVDARKLAPDAVSIDFGLDPVGDMVRTGVSPLPVDGLLDRLGETVRDLAARGFKRSLVRVDARAVHEAGGSQVDELAFALATGVHYLRALEARGQSLEAARDALSVLLAADDDQFMTMAKFRAMRLLWARVEEACGLAPRPLGLAAETSWRMTTRRDPWVNMLRVTVAAFAAGLGGADSVTVLPLTAALGLADGFARRMARNTQLILLEEANLWRVADPAAGAGGIETLTDELAHRAWDAFQTIEKTGGIVAALGSGQVQSGIAQVRAARQKAIAQRKVQITGTSEFPNVHEAAVEVLTPAQANATPHAERIAPSGPFPDLIAQARAGAAMPEGFARVATPVFAALASHRDGEAFEALRDAADAKLAASGSRPKVFLANLGPIAAFTARATFAKNFFEAGGIEALSNDGFPSNEAMAEAFKASGARIACLCSSDDVYAASAVEAVGALKAAGAGEIYLAGRPGDLEAALKDAGVTRFVYAGADLVATLTEAMEHA
ncbi:methylmalonyl-CoA mutase family protein [Chelatococcus reniformis]|uniref:Methylmalonyl-CoA mutase n=1 Tax=Chelatococcus reniformis TaxID=1494448 RepID=A0A916UIV9_9HYPH|nr:methylmalonyl-CoA mutase family protein [Chelatococcus reniformis]GGC73834.1 methylmalonyl-CoA mutase [Chelatococcus reniformis]